MDREPVPLLEMSKMTTMPTPWASTDDGECWVWGDYFFLVQREPPTFQEIIQAADGQLKRGPMTYLLALVGFYKADRNPFPRPDNQPTNRPVIAMAIEQVDYNLAAGGRNVSAMPAESRKILGIGEDGQGTKVFGVFFQGEILDPAGVDQFSSSYPGRYNLGAYEGAATRDAMRKQLFDAVPKFLPVDGVPIKIGALRDAMGHPSTGLPSNFMGGNLPALKSPSQKQPAKQGCLAAALIMVSLLSSLLAYGVSAAISAGS